MAISIVSSLYRCCVINWMHHTDPLDFFTTLSRKWHFFGLVHTEAFLVFSTKALLWPGPSTVRRANPHKNNDHVQHGVDFAPLLAQIRFSKVDWIVWLMTAVFHPRDLCCVCVKRRLTYRKFEITVFEVWTRDGCVQKPDCTMSEVVKGKCLNYEDLAPNCYFTMSRLWKEHVWGMDFRQFCSKMLLHHVSSINGLCLRWEVQMVAFWHATSPLLEFQIKCVTWKCKMFLI